MNLSSKIRAINDYPIDGIVFRDITTLLSDKEAFKESIKQMAELRKDSLVDKVIGVEARGFIFGAAVAYELGCGFVPVRKPGKLPSEKLTEEYALEYGTDTIEMHIDAVNKGERVIIVDDLLATGGTSEAVTKLVKKAGGEIVGLDFLIELVELNGREKLKDYDVKSIIKY